MNKNRIIKNEKKNLKILIKIKFIYLLEPTFLKTMVEKIKVITKL